MTLSAVAGAMIGFKLLETTMKIDDQNKNRLQDTFLERRQNLIGTIGATNPALGCALVYPVYINPDLFYESNSIAASLAFECCLLVAR
mgnify:FL=1